MRSSIAVICRAFLVFSASLAPLLAQTPGGQPQQPEFIRQGQQMMRDGKLDDALALYLQTLQSSPTSVPANIAAGSVLDLKGQGEEARKYFAKAIEVANSPEHRATAQRAMAMSHACVLEEEAGLVSELAFRLVARVRNVLWHCADGVICVAARALAARHDPQEMKLGNN